MGDGSEVPLRALGAVLADLADVGYDAAWYGLRAADVGAAHGRFRVFIFAWPADADGDGFQGIGRVGTEQRDADGLHRAGQAAADLTLLPTPAVNDMGASYTPEEWDAWTAAMQAKHGNGNGHGKSLAIEAQRLDGPVFRTPTAQLAVNGGSQHPDKRKAGGHGPTLADEVEHLLPTPAARDWKDHRVEVAKHRPDDETTLNRAIAHHLLPTPRATDGTKGGPNQRGSSGDLMLPSAVNLLPTPSVADVEGGRKHRSGERSDELLLNGIAHHDRWGDYAPAIARWEAVIGRPAPAPTEPGPKGNPRLSARFVEWLMGLPEGHVTDPAIGLTRNEQLKALGNGVVPQQAVAATRALVEDMARAVVA